MVESWEIAGRTLEFIEETHTYIYDGVILPSITQILKQSSVRNIMEYQKRF